MNTIPTITPQQIAEFAATHEFNECGYSNWFRLEARRNGTFVDPSGGFLARQFDEVQVLTVAVGLDQIFRARPLQTETARPT